MQTIRRKRGIYPAPYTLGIGAAVISILCHFCFCIILSETRILNLKVMDLEMARQQRVLVDLVEIPLTDFEMKNLEAKYNTPEETSLLSKPAEEILKEAYSSDTDETPSDLSPIGPPLEPTDTLKDYNFIEQQPDALIPDSALAYLPEELVTTDELASVPEPAKIEVPVGRKFRGTVAIPVLKKKTLSIGSAPNWISPKQPTLQALKPMTVPLQPQEIDTTIEPYVFTLPKVSLDTTVDIEPAEASDYETLTKDVDVRFSIYHEARTNHQFFKVTITPRRDAVFAPIPKDVLFAIDVSSSISISELREVRSALGKCLQTLNEDDRFNVVIFSTECKWLFRDFQEVSAKRIRSANEFMSRLSYMEMTDIYATLEEMLKSIHPPDQQRSKQPYERPCNIILISDGSPTTGITDVRKIVGDLVHVRPANTSIFTFDIGKKGNRYLLDLIAFESRGYSSVEKNVKMGRYKLKEFIKKYNDPIMLGVAVNYANLEEGDIYPRVLPNLYGREGIEIYGICKPGSEVALRIVGDAYGEKRELIITKKIPIGGEGGPEIAREWATRKAYYLISRVALEGQHKEWLAEIERLREEYAINVPYSVAPGKSWFKNIFYRFIK